MQHPIPKAALDPINILQTHTGKHIQQDACLYRHMLACINTSQHRNTNSEPVVCHPSLSGCTRVVGSDSLAFRKVFVRTYLTTDNCYTITGDQDDLVFLMASLSDISNADVGRCREIDLSYIPPTPPPPRPRWRWLSSPLWESKQQCVVRKWIWAWGTGYVSYI